MKVAPDVRCEGSVEVPGDERAGESIILRIEIRYNSENDLWKAERVLFLSRLCPSIWLFKVWRGGIYLERGDIYTTPVLGPIVNPEQSWALEYEMAGEIAIVGFQYDKARPILIDLLKSI